MGTDSTSTAAGSADKTTCLELVAIPGLPYFMPGDDLSGAILDAATAADLAVRDGDVLVVAQKVVSKSEGAYVDLADVVPSAAALQLSALTGKDARLVEVILSESREIVRARPGLIIAAHRLGPVLANAGIDRSNIDGSGREVVLLLPRDPDESAARLRRDMAARAGASVAVVINDSWGRAWRNGSLGHAIGAAGLPAVWDRRGDVDIYGRTLHVTQIGLADEIAAAASLVMGAAAESQPVVIVRGLVLPKGDGSARDLVRDKAQDLFR